MTREDLSQILKSKIPLSKAMGIRVSGCSVLGGVKFHLPLKPNRNHKNTAFGGTLVAAQALASWAWMMELLDKYNISAEVVVQRQHSEFRLPVKKNFRVATQKVSDAEIKRFLRTLARRHRARLRVSARVLSGGRLAAEYTGEYVALRI